MQIRARTPLLIALAGAILLLDALAALEADAVFGTRRRTAMVTAAVVSSKKDAEYAEKEAAEASKEAEAAKAEAAAPAAEPAPQPSGAKPIGTVVTTLPAGCQETTIGNVAYQKCGPDYYRAAFQGSQLVYVTAQP